MSDCNNDCENCKIEEFCGYSVDTLGYAEFSRLVEEHDKKIRESAIDDVIKKLAESEDTILTDKQYYTLMEMKEQKSGN